MFIIIVIVIHFWYEISLLIYEITGWSLPQFFLSVSVETQNLYQTYFSRPFQMEILVSQKKFSNKSTPDKSAKTQSECLFQQLVLYEVQSQVQRATLQAGSLDQNINGLFTFSFQFVLRPHYMHIALSFTVPFLICFSSPLSLSANFFLVYDYHLSMQIHLTRD